MVEAPRKRVRDYSAERRRRNAQARLWGFTSLDQMSKARRRGEFPSAALLRRDPEEGIRARTRLAAKARRALEATGPGTPGRGRDTARHPRNARRERKRGVGGKSVLVGLDLGGRGVINS